MGQVKTIGTVVNVDVAGAVGFVSLLQERLPSFIADSSSSTDCWIDCQG